MNEQKIYAVDIDGTLTTHKEYPQYYNISPKEMAEVYSIAEPNLEIIKKIREIYINNDRIILFTSRSDLFRIETENWLSRYNVPYDEIIFNKPFYNFIIDDKSLFLEGISYSNE